jgi:homospermidine synthase
MSRLGTSTGPFFIGYELETTSSEGSETVEVWQGSQDECIAKKNLLVAQGAKRVKLSNGPGGDWQVRATWPSDPNDPNDVGA